MGSQATGTRSSTWRTICECALTHLRSWQVGKPREETDHMLFQEADDLQHCYLWIPHQAIPVRLDGNWPCARTASFSCLLGSWKRTYDSLSVLQVFSARDGSILDFQVKFVSAQGGCIRPDLQAISNALT